MSQGFKSGRHRANSKDEARWAFFSRTDEPFPTNPEILLHVVDALRSLLQRLDRSVNKRVSEAAIRVSLPASSDDLVREVERLLGLIHSFDRSKGKQLTKRLRLYLRVMSQRDHCPGELELNWYRLKVGHYGLLFEEELTAIKEGKFLRFTCLPGVIRLQRDHLHSYLNRRVIINEKTGALFGDGYARRRDTIQSWLKRNSERVFEELTFWHCACQYPADLGELQYVGLKGLGELVPAILSAIHALSPTSIRKICKASSRPGDLPPFLT